MLEMATREEKAVAERLIENALEDCVSTFDGFGRELCRIHANKARNPSKAERMNFQNLEAARKRFLDLFGFDLSAEVARDEWRAAVVAFQKRHLIAHRFGVVDQDYMDKTGDFGAVVGRKVTVDVDEVKRLAKTVNTLAPRAGAWLQKLDGQS